jgi:peptidoglycan/xylan/chitin deacetylase (PgdA/CDA1 family)
MPGDLRPAFVHGLVARTRTRGPGVHLTFDDGPLPEFTPGVLDRLAAYRIAATFYMVGRRVEADPALARRAADAGHAVGCHSFGHGRTPAFGFRECVADLQRCVGAVAGACGRMPTAFRPPLGRLTPGWVWAAWRCRLPIALWSLDVRDWRCRSAADAVRAAGVAAREARAGDVILLHDAHPWAGTLLDALLPALSDRGLV